MVITTSKHGRLQSETCIRVFFHWDGRCNELISHLITCTENFAMVFLVANFFIGFIRATINLTPKCNREEVCLLLSSWNNSGELLGYLLVQLIGFRFRQFLKTLALHKCARVFVDTPQNYILKQTSKLKSYTEEGKLRMQERHWLCHCAIWPIVTKNPREDLVNLNCT